MALECRCSIHERNGSRRRSPAPGCPGTATPRALKGPWSSRAAFATSGRSDQRPRPARTRRFEVEIKAGPDVTSARRENRPRRTCTSRQTDRHTRRRMWTRDRAHERESGRRRDDDRSAVGCIPARVHDDGSGRRRIFDATRVRAVEGSRDADAQTGRRSRAANATYRRWN